MCGIAGLVSRGSDRPDDAGLWRAADLMRHRGPDGADVWCGPGAGLAHTRLAIIDRAHGAQPMVSADGRYVIVFNGEIYNHHELRRDLEGRGRSFRTRCDTEVLPELYAAEGPGMVRRLRGMFAFAILDRVEHSLFLARDRFGKKPLYLAERGGGLAFASTLDALAAAADLPLDLEPQALFEYLVMQYVPSPLSPIAGTAKLAPGHSALWRDGSLEMRQYWKPPARAGNVRRGAPTPDDLAQVKETIGDAVRSRLESEVPLGVFLSGGLDSSIVVAEIARAGIRARTFSVGFRSDQHDETRYAAEVAERFGTDHTRLVADDDVQTLFDRFTTAYDEPFADSSALATLAVARAAREHVTVVLTGDGGDEIFGGYERYGWFRRGAETREKLGPFANAAGGAATGIGRMLGNGRLRHAGSLVRDPWAWYRDALFHFSPAGARSLLRPDVAASIDAAGPVRRLDGLWARGTGSLSDLGWVDEHTYLADDLLTKMDRATMSFSVEARSPLLDHVLAEQAARFPDSWLFSGGRGKAILRAAYRDELPEAVLTRPKMGFGVPIERWLKGPLRSEVERLLLGDSALWTWLRPDATSRLVSAFLDGGPVRARLVWNLTALAGWADRRVGARPALVGEAGR
jgi:asparagine synthase (glutamine-hydrolysing)